MPVVIDKPRKLSKEDKKVLKRETIYGSTKKYNCDVLYFKVGKYHKQWDVIIRKIENKEFVKLAEPELIRFEKVLKSETDRASVFRRGVVVDSLKAIKVFLKHHGLSVHASTKTVLEFFDRKYQQSEPWSSLSFPEKVERTIEYALKNETPYCTSVGIENLEPIPSSYFSGIDLFRNPNPIDNIKFRTETDTNSGVELDKWTIEGVSYAQMYVSTGGASSAFHQEEFTLGSIFWLLRGAEKIWLTIDANEENVKRFREVIRTQTKSSCAAFLQSKNIACLTAFLRDNEIKSTIYRQKPGTVLILSGHVYHAVFNTGISYGLASNFVDYNCSILTDVNQVPYCDLLPECELEGHGKSESVFDIRDYKSIIAEWVENNFNWEKSYIGPTRLKYIKFYSDKRLKSKCTLCGKIVIELKQHMLTHEPKLIECTKCSKKFSRMSNMNRHAKTHLQI